MRRWLRGRQVQPDGSCICDNGYVGESCQYSKSADCSDQGQVQPDGSCLCAEGYSGESCEDAVVDADTHPADAGANDVPIVDTPAAEVSTADVSDADATSTTDGGQSDLTKGSAGSSSSSGCTMSGRPHPLTAGFMVLALILLCLLSSKVRSRRGMKPTRGDLQSRL